MFAKVRQAGEVLWVAEVSDFDVHGGGGLVSFRVRDDHGLEAVLEHDEPVRAVVVRTLLYTLGVDGIRRQTILGGYGLPRVLWEMVEGRTGAGDKGVRRIGFVVGVGDGHDRVAEVSFVQVVPRQDWWELGYGRAV